MALAHGVGAFGLLLPIWIALDVSQRRRARQRRLLAEGVTAAARVLSVTETGRGRGQRPLLRIRLEVVPADHDPFEATVERRASLLELPRLQPGSVVEVRYLPDGAGSLELASLTDRPALPSPAADP